MKRTNVVVDEVKIKEAKRAFELDSAREVIDLALTELLRMHHRKAILDLSGRVQIDLDLNQSRKIGK